MLQANDSSAFVHEPLTTPSRPSPTSSDAVRRRPIHSIIIINSILKSDQIETFRGMTRISSWIEPEASRAEIDEPSGT